MKTCLEHSPRPPKCPAEAQGFTNQEGAKPTSEKRIPLCCGEWVSMSDLSRRRDFLRLASGLLLASGAGSFVGCGGGGGDNITPTPTPTPAPTSLLYTRLSPTPVTVAQYRAYCSATGKTMPPAPMWGLINDHPIVNVSWYEATAYATWAGGRLPTAAEFEYGQTDGGKSLVYPWGDDFEDSNLWCSVATDRASTAPVRRSHNIYVNSLGLSDMAGNVWQWCSDGPDGSSDKYMKGGSWFDNNVFSFRNTNHPSVNAFVAGISNGFRLMLP